ncbi:endoribonuclease dcr-1-like [Oratosquilla oratoria]|uniref:endoribonuclease dcr-1-like n=1 Tax=Oratosquilla oratoria TaxID=337810 RepID=UPI003F76EA5D
MDLLNHTSSEDSEDTDAEDQPDVKENDTHVPRPYQLELYERAKEKNCILVLGTGSGKTFIGILLIKEFAESIRGSIRDGYKRTIFVVNTVPLVHQQHKAIFDHTPFKVGKYEGSMGVDLWSEEKWKEEVEKHEVIVLSAQILVDLILHARLRIRDINLIIMDECHHATGKHPMREIMRSYIEEEESYRPRIVGLTACIIHKKVRENKINKEMKTLEEVMDSTLETATDQVLVEQYTTKPEEIIIGYSGTSIGNVQEYVDLDAAIESKFKNETEGESDFGIGLKDVKDLKKIVRNIKNVSLDLGPWCEMQALLYEMEDIKEKAEREDNPAMAQELESLNERFKNMYTKRYEGPMGNGDPREFVTHKVKRLLELLVSCRTIDLHCLIFVEQRCTAKILFDLLQKIKQCERKLTYLNPAYVVGSNQSLDINLAQLELKKQKETLHKFRKGEFNVIVSTSVLEEGIDVRVCNLVIRFDPPKTFRSYVQSRGRARDSPSRYVFFASHVDEMRGDIVLYREMERCLKSKCHDRLHPDEEDIKDNFRSDEELPPYAPYGTSGPKVTMNSALSLVNKYCQTLPQDKFTKLGPEYRFIKVRKISGPPYHKCYLQLPVSSQIKEALWSEPQKYKDLAKRDVALIACRKLHEIRELNMSLLPIPLKDEGLFQDLVEIPDEVTKEVQKKVGSRKLRRVYEKELCSAYKDFHSYRLFAIHIHHLEKNPDGPVVSSSCSSSHLGLLVSGPICQSSFPLESTKFGKVVVTFECLSENYKVDTETMKNIENFHKMVLQISLGIPDNLHEFKEEKLPLLILPLREYSVDLELLHEVNVFSTLKSERPQDGDRQRCILRKDKFSNGVVICWYDYKREIYIVTNILDDLTPCSDFPENKNIYKSYKDYYKKKYDIEIYDNNQFLLEAKHVPKGLSLFKPVVTKTKVSKSKKPHLVPELCWLTPFKVPLLWQIILLPSILHRNNMLNLCYELGSQIIFNSLCPLYDMGTCHYDWAKVQIEKIMASGYNNFCVALEYMESIHLHPWMILNALTLKSADDAFDMERLEVLGDSFLKFFCGERIFLADSSAHEGRLSQKRSVLVSNKSLYVLAWKKGIPKLIQGTKFVPVENSFLYGFQIKQVYEKQLLKQRVCANQWHTVKIQNNKIVQDAEGHGEDEKYECYNPWTHHQVADKSVADVVEALIGVYLFTGGPKRAIKFLEWIKLPIPKEEMMQHDALIKKDSIAYVRKMYKQLCFDQLERILQYQFTEKSFLLQALTHPSYMANRATDSYQRLEFLGDAVLDYLVTGHIYSNFQKYSPGEMTDLRSHLVNNETLAKVAVKHNLQKYLLHMSPQLQFGIDTFIGLMNCGEVYFTREDEVDVFEDVEVPKALGDIVESLIGAIYLDSKRDLQVTWNVIYNLMGDHLVDNIKDIPINCIRNVYEMDANAQFVGTSEDNDYRMTLTVCGETFHGKGKNKRIAKIAAAKIALKYLRSKS